MADRTGNRVDKGVLIGQAIRSQRRLHKFHRFLGGNVVIKCSRFLQIVGVRNACVGEHGQIFQLKRPCCRRGVGFGFAHRQNSGGRVPLRSLYGERRAAGFVLIGHAVLIHLELDAIRASLSLILPGLGHRKSDLTGAGIGQKHAVVPLCHCGGSILAAAVVHRSGDRVGTAAARIPQSLGRIYRGLRAVFLGAAHQIFQHEVIPRAAAAQFLIQGGHTYQCPPVIFAEGMIHIGQGAQRIQGDLPCPAPQGFRKRGLTENANGDGLALIHIAVVVPRFGNGNDGDRTA